jgi:hypothetical protein
MLRLLKFIFCTAVFGAAVQTSFGFALLGPLNEAYQVPNIGYGLDTDIGGPKNLGEEYRRNTPVMYYTCDANFWNYFGAKGVAAVDGAFNVFNNLTGVDTWSSDLSEFPLTTSRHNYQAEALFLFDVKAWTMQLIIETLGLTEPVRYTWGIHERWLPGGGPPCPFGEAYWIIKRNFDPAYGTSLDQLKPTSYVNGTLFTYEIMEFCTAALPPVAYARPFPVDPLADPSTAVAEFYNFGSAFGGFSYSPYGWFYNGLTRDDVGGLRYLYRTNNVNYEFAGPDSLVHVTNTTPTLLVTSNLTLLAFQALTNDAPTLQALYPNLNILTTSNFFSNIYTTNYTAYFTNFPWDPVGTPAHLAFLTNVTSSVATLYAESFGNVEQVVPSATSPSGWTFVPLVTPPRANGRAWVTVQTTTVGISNNPWGPVGSTQTITNTTSQTYQTNGVVGDYVILPTNWCDVAIIASQLTNVTSFTNPITVATNFLINTNVSGSLISFTQNLVTYFTNHYFVVYPIICQTNTALYQGVEHTTFIRRDFDSLTGRFFSPLTNTYILNMITNNMVIPQKVSRVVVRPDILITAQDLTSGPDTSPPRISALVRSIGSYNTNQENLLLAGPGTIESGTLNVANFGPLPATQFVFNNVGPLFENFGLVDTNAFLEEQSQFPIFLWGSFDGTTNAPTLYPNDVSIGELENQMLVPVTPQYLPVGNINASYTVELQTRDNPPGWQGPFTWSLAPNSPGLPPGLGINTDGYNTANISGVPYQSGTFDFVLEITDSQGNTVDRSTFIQVGP